MGSIEEGPPVVGKYNFPVITQDTTNGDPWLRKYYAPPQHHHLTERSYPLIDVRPLLLHPEYSPTDLLRTHGFGVVKHHSTFIDLLDGDLADDTLAEVYHPEIRDLVMKTLGAKSFFITGTAYRQGKRAPEVWRPPIELRPMAQAEAVERNNGDDVKPHKLANQSKLALAAPVRRPHMDYTPLGARQMIRSSRQDIFDAATRSGVIAAEDKICEQHPFSASDKESDALITELYNKNGNPGPRYAAYSIWRPLKKVGRDPITFAPRKEIPSVGGEMVHWPYLNRIPGPAELNGDFLKEYAMLGVREEEPPAGTKDALEWYWIPAQEPDEVVFIKQFDSASLGSDSQHAGAPWHGSPEIGDVVSNDDPRESIDVRVLVFW